MATKWEKHSRNNKEKDKTNLATYLKKKASSQPESVLVIIFYIKIYQANEN